MTDAAAPRCYGHHRSASDDCQSCPEAVWCRQAKDPEPLTGPTRGDDGGDAAYELAIATVEAETEAVRDTREQLGSALAEVLRLSGRNPDRIEMLLARIHGKSLSDVGAAQGKSKQAVAKDIACIEAKGGPMVGRALRQRHPSTAMTNAMIAMAVSRHKKQHPTRPLCGPGGVYDRVARLFGLETWESVVMRLHRRRRFNAQVDSVKSDTVATKAPAAAG
jgi:hypothetical protein